MLQQTSMFSPTEHASNGIHVSDWPGAPSGEKPCVNCGLPQPYSNFMRNRYSADGFNKWCKTCLSAASIAAKQNPKPKRKPAKRRKTAKRRSGGVARRAAPAPRTAPKSAPTAAPALRIVKADELPDLTAEWLVYGMVPSASFVVLAGGAGVGKSFLALDWAASTAQNGAAIYVLAEGGAHFAARIAAWREANGLNVDNLYVVPSALNLLNAAEVNAFIEQIAPLEPKMIVFDTLARCFGSYSENSTKSMSAFVEAVGRLIDRFSASIVVLHHMDKKSQAERGSGALRAGADLVYVLSEDEDNEGALQLKSVKVKDSEPISQALRLAPVRLPNGRGSCTIEYGFGDGSFE